MVSCDTDFYEEPMAQISLSNIIVVSDIDDTIKWSHILGPEVLVDGLNPHLAFKGMPELYTFLADAGSIRV